MIPPKIGHDHINPDAIEAVAPIPDEANPGVAPAIDPPG